MKNNLLKVWRMLSIVLFTLWSGFHFFSLNVSAQPDNALVIVIDPGHGGEKEGAMYDGYMEKELTMTVARAMKEELEKYENVEVYLTRQGDQDMSIKDRAAFAGEKNADFLFCLHFNSSISHSLYGSEIWVPTEGVYYAKGYSFAQMELQALTELGIYPRGIKTRLNDRGENYYGILRYCTLEDIPAVLIEHCHMDHEKDKEFYQQGDEQLRELGRLDATVAAQYFQLKSEILGVDYGDYPVPETAIPKEIVRPDKSEPNLCKIEVEKADESTGEVSIYMEAEDEDSYILYYCYSTDGGNTYYPLEEWPRPDGWNRSAKSHSFQVTIPMGEEVELRAAAYNGFDVFAESNMITIGPFEEKEPKEPEKTPEGMQDAGEDFNHESSDSKNPDIEDSDIEDSDTENSNNKNAEAVENNSAKGERAVLENEAADRTHTLLAGSLIALIVIFIILLSYFMAKMIILLLRDNRKP